MLLGLLIITVTCFMINIQAQANQEITFAFGSCFKFYRSQKSEVFSRIAKHNPEFFLWLGDAAYIDIMRFPAIWHPDPSPISVEKKFNISKHDPDYSAFRQKFKVYGVYDDHDYGLNNGDKNQPYKQMNKEKYLDFLDIPRDHPLRKQEGIYQVIDINQYIKLILFDIRYFQDQVRRDLLGDQQWEWLEKQFQNNKTELFFLASGIQFFPDDRFPCESWFLESKERLFTLIQKYKANVIFLSGDVHQAELLKLHCSLQRYGRQFYEFTSSGLNFANGEQYPLFEYLSQMGLGPYNRREQRFYNSNYGLIKIQVNQAGKPQKIKFEARYSKDSSVKLEQTVHISELSYDENQIDFSKPCILDEPGILRLSKHRKQVIFEGIYQVIAMCSLIVLVLVCKFLQLKWWFKKVKQLYHNQLPID